jgi:hypothetical protein
MLSNLWKKLVRNYPESSRRAAVAADGTPTPPPFQARIISNGAMELKEQIHDRLKLLMFYVHEFTTKDAKDIWLSASPDAHPIGDLTEIIADVMTRMNEYAGVSPETRNVAAVWSARSIYPATAVLQACHLLRQSGHIGNPWEAPIIERRNLMKSLLSPEMFEEFASSSPPWPDADQRDRVRRRAALSEEGRRFAMTYRI